MTLGGLTCYPIIDLLGSLVYNAIGSKGACLYLPQFTPPEY